MFVGRNEKIFVIPNIKINKIGSNFVKVAVLDKDGNALETKTVEGDVVVNALASSKVKFDVEGVTANVHYVGDCKDGSPCNLDNATKSAYDVANSL
jgi:hypothetical protein